MNLHYSTIMTALFLLLILGIVSSEIKYSETECPPWFFYNSSSNHCQCYKNTNLEDDIQCQKAGALITIGNCMTYTKDEGTFFARCFYFQLPPGNVTQVGHFLLPRNASELNDYMCTPMKRKGIVCRECIDGFGPSVTSLGYECTNCSDAWKGILLYIIAEFGPTTLFYFIVLSFRISMTSAPMTCFIMYSQIVVYALFRDRDTLNHIILQSEHNIIVKYTVVTVGSLYGIWNLDFLQYVVPPVCISSSLSIIHVDFLSCISALYSLFLVFLTWLCIELHGRNFKPFIILWRPFHSCFVRLRKGCNTKTDIINVFASFLYLTYSKLTYQSVQILNSQYIFKNGTPYTKVTLNDPSIPYMKRQHLPFAIISMLIWIVFVIPPALILFLYPTKAFNWCLTKCRLNGRPGVALKIFTEKFYGCYKDHLDGGCDMRKFSVVYFVLRPFMLVLHLLRQLHISHHTWFYAIVIFAGLSVFTAYIKPYKQSYMNFVDTLLLAHMSLLCLLTVTSFKHNYIIGFILMTIPLFVFLLVHALRMIRRLKNSKLLRKILKSVPKCCKKKTTISYSSRLWSIL